MLFNKQNESSLKKSACAKNETYMKPNEKRGKTVTMYPFTHAFDRS